MYHCTDQWRNAYTIRPLYPYSMRPTRFDFIPDRTGELDQLDPTVGDRRYVRALAIHECPHCGQRIMRLSETSVDVHVQIPLFLCCSMTGEDNHVRLVSGLQG
jgi:hypothetical protein